MKETVLLVFSPSSANSNALISGVSAYARQRKWRIHMIDKALQLINEKACQGLKAKDVIAALPGSRRYAERDFLKATGKSILQTIIDVRLEKVKELLQNPKCTISAIASQCGWTSSNYLRRAFQERMHMSMSDWRKQNVRG